MGFFWIFVFVLVFWRLILVIGDCGGSVGVGRDLEGFLFGVRFREVVGVSETIGFYYICFFRGFCLELRVVFTLV